MDIATAREQLGSIAEVLAVADGLDMPIWLRGGWAMDFFLGRISRDHLDVDWFALHTDGPLLGRQLIERGFTNVARVPADQQIDVIRGSIEHGIGLIRLHNGLPFVAGGPFAGEPWPPETLDGPICHLSGIAARVVAPTAQIEIKRMTPTWNPALGRRQKDLDDIAAIQAKLQPHDESLD